MNQDLIAGKAVFITIPIFGIISIVLGVWFWTKGWWYAAFPVFVIAAINIWQSVILFKWKYKDKMTYEQILYNIGGGIPAYIANTLIKK